MISPETPNTRCPKCRGEWLTPSLSEAECTELLDLLVADRIAFIRRLRELSGIGLASAKAIMMHMSLPPGRCNWCKGALSPSPTVICPQCSSLNFFWNTAPSQAGSTKPTQD
jgi:hypothetical protein